MHKAEILRLQATGWWSWSDSNQPPECYGIWACPTSPPRRTPALALKKSAIDGLFHKRGISKNPALRNGPVGSTWTNHAKQQNSRYLDGCPTKGVGRTPTMFHNTLVVGSSPTSSTTQSRETGEIQIRLQP